MKEFWKPTKGAKLETWGAFLEWVSMHGVEHRTDSEYVRPDGTVGTLRYLYRNDNGNPRTYALPDPCPDERRMGYPRVLAACIALSIPRPEWPISF